MKITGHLPARGVGYPSRLAALPKFRVLIPSVAMFCILIILPLCFGT